MVADYLWQKTATKCTGSDYRAYLENGTERYGMEAVSDREKAIHHGILFCPLSSERLTDRWELGELIVRSDNVYFQKGR